MTNPRRGSRASPAVSPAHAPPAVLPGEGSLAAGTLVAAISASGSIADVPVESLAPGMTILTLSGSSEEATPIRAIHRADTDPSTSPDPARVAAIRIHAAAIAPHMPAADLLLPPDGLLRLRDSLPPDVPIGPDEDPGHLVPAAALLNSASVTREPGPVSWYTLDLGDHTILLAAGTAVGSARVADTGARPTPCIPLLPPGLALNAHRQRIASRAREAELPLQPNSPPRFRPRPLPKADGPPATPIIVLAAGATVPLEEPTPLTFACTLPARTGPIRLRSPLRRAADAHDGRPFGVCVAAVELDGTALDFTAPCFGPGFHPVESNERNSWRWTSGDAWLVLPYSPTPRTLRLTLTPWHTALALA